MKKLREVRVLPVLLATVVLVVGANLAAHAATGKGFLLGQRNNADRPSTLTNTGDGPALRLRTDAAAPPMFVTSNRKVTRLNADMLDGVDASALQTRSTLFHLPGQTNVSSFTLSLPGVAPGFYAASYSIEGVTMSSAGATINCAFGNSGFTHSHLLTYGSSYVNNSNFSTVSASGVLDMTSELLRFRCFASAGTMSMSGSAVLNDSQLVLTRIDALVDGGTLAPSP